MILQQKCFHNGSGNGNGKVIQHGLPKKDIGEDEQQALRRLREHCFANFEGLYKNQFLYRQAQYKYLQGTEAMQISPVDAINRLKVEIYDQVKALTPDKSGDQAPSCIIIAGTSEDHSFEIFSHNADSGKHHGKDNVWIDGAFGVAINIRESEHRKNTGAFESSAYMVQHLAHEGEHVPYILYITDFGTKDKAREISKVQKMEQMEEMRRMTISQWKKAGFCVIDENGKVPYLLLHAHGQETKTFLPIVFHDLVECQYSVHEGGQAVPLEKWICSEGLDTDRRVRNHLKALELHREEAAYFDDYILRTYKRRKITCVDSREDEQMSSSIRLMGGIAKEAQMERILQSCDYFTVSLHFGCGYLKTAMGIHEMGREIMLLLSETEKRGRVKRAVDIRNFLKGGLESVFKDKWTGFDEHTFIGLLESASGRPSPMSDNSKGMLHELLGSQTSDTREIARHMYNRKILDWSKEHGTIVMPSALEVDGRPENDSLVLHLGEGSEEGMAKKRTPDEITKYYEKITLMVAKNEIGYWEDALNRTKSDCIVKVQVKDYKDAVVVSTNKLGTEMKDAITGEDIA